MFRYRMNTRSKSRLGVVVVLILVGILLIWVAAHMGDSPQQDIDQPTATEAGVDNLLLRLYQGVRAAGVAFWQQFMGFGSSESIPVDIDLTGAQSVGAGEDDPEEEVIPDEGVKVEVVDPQEPESFGAAGAAPQILIYHTHTHESYTKTAGQNYVESAQWRTTNNDYNIVRVGEELAKTLSEKYGIAVLHDKTDNEYPQLGTAYSRSLITMQKDMKANPGLKLLIDLHRDAYNTGIDPSVATIDGQKVARVMAVIGTGEGKTGTGFAVRPKWQENKKVADSILDRLAQFSPDLARKTDVKTGRYNQHLSTGAILLEIGHNKNTLDEALAAVPYLAQAIAETFAKLPGVEAAPTTATTTKTASTVPAATPSPTPGATGSTAAASATGAVDVDLEPLIPMQSNPP